MPQIDTLRPVSVVTAGDSTIVPSGTLNGVTSDNNDSTYARSVPAGYGQPLSLRVASHTPASGYQRHRVRGRVRVRTDAGTMSDAINLGQGIQHIWEFDLLTATDSFAEYAGSWYTNPVFGLATEGALADLNVGGGWAADATGGATELRASEYYVDIDTRQEPQFAPEVRDAAGVNQAGGTITDTTQPTLYFGGVAYDDLPPLDWSVEITDDLGNVVYSQTGSGTPPTSIPTTVSLPNGDFFVTFLVRSTIRAADPFPSGWSLPFTLDNEAPPPSPPLLTVEENFGGYQVSWSNPGGAQWDTSYPLVAEVWRDDCTGSHRIAVVPDGLNGSYLDLAIPQLDSRPDCEPQPSACDITYRVRYWGYVSESVEIPSTIPTDLILAWPGTTGSIPDGWSRVTALDGYHPRGATGTGAPVATGGAASHTHTTPNHRHTIGAHSHVITGNTTGSGDSTNTARFNGADQPTANQSHAHPLPGNTGTAVAFSSALTAAGVNSVANDPPTRNVIWISSDGTETAYPVGALAFSVESVSGWTADTASAGRFLRGASAIDGGGAIYGSATHHHTVEEHTHTSASHDHTIGNTGLSTPVAATEAEQGGGDGGTPRWIPRHTHLMNVVPTNTGTLIAGWAGNTSEVTREPRHRRLRVLRNVGGGAQTRVIGLYLGALADLDPVLTLCDGRAGTPDMRGLFAREAGSAGAINTIGGQDNHFHTCPNHTHAIPPHKHELQVGATQSRSYTRRSGGNQGAVPIVAHDHNAGDTMIAAPSIGSAGAGNTSTSSLVPPYREVHFVRVDGNTAGGELPVPELKVTEFAEITVPAFTYGDGLDRLASRTEKLAVVTDRSHEFPRLVTESVPLAGGLHTVSNTPAGDQMALTIAVQGMPAIDALEALLAADRVYWSPVAGTPGWFAPEGWSVSAPAPEVKVLQISMVRQPWPSTPDVEDFL